MVSDNVRVKGKMLRHATLARSATVMSSARCSSTYARTRLNLLSSSRCGDFIGVWRAWCANSVIVIGAALCKGRGHARFAGDLVQRRAGRDALARQVSDRGAEDVAGVRRRRVGQDLDPVGPCLAHGLCVVLTEEAVCQLRRFCYGRGVVFLAAHGRISHYRDADGSRCGVRLCRQSDGTSQAASMET